MNDVSKRVKELLGVLEVPEGSKITVEENKPGYLDISVEGKYFDTYDTTQDCLIHGNLCFARQDMQNESYVSVTLANSKLYRSERNYKAVEVWCPATENELQDALQRARVEQKDVVVVGCTILGKTFHEQDYLLLNSSVEELNYLGERLRFMEDIDRTLFKGSMEKHDEKMVTVKDCINMTYNLEECQIANGVTDLKELGMFFAEQNMVSELQNLPLEALELIDYTKIGEKIHAEKKGIFIDEGYFYDEIKDFKVLYDGKTLPEQMKNDHYLFRVKVSKQTGTSEKISGGIWVSLPQEAEQLNNVPKALGADSWDACCLLGVQSILQDMQLCISKANEIEKLNLLLQEIDKFNRVDQMKFKAVLEISVYQGIEDIREMINQLGNYQLYDTMVSTANYAFHQLITKDNAKIPENLLEFIDFNSYYRTFMEDDCIINTDYGILKRIDGQRIQANEIIY